MIAVEQVAPQTAAWTEFCELGSRLSDRPNCVVSPATKTAASVWRPKFAASQWVGLARRDGRPAARTVARISPTLRDDSDRPLGMLGHFEAHDDPAAVAALFDASIAWLREQGARTLLGPLDGDTWHRYRFNIGPWDEPPFLMEPFQHPYYCPLWEAYGFRPLEHYYSKRVDDVPAAESRLNAVRRRVEQQGYRLRPYQPDRYEDELRLLYDLSLAVFAGNYLYEPIEWEEFRALYDPLRSLIVPELLQFAFAPDGTPAGFLFATIDWQIAAAAASRRHGLAAKLAFLWNRRRASAVNLKSLGVVAAYRRSGLGAALMHEGYRQTLRLGYRRANLCLIREGNPSGHLDGDVGVVSRRYVLYQLPEAAQS